MKTARVQGQARTIMHLRTCIVPFFSTYQSLCVMWPQLTLFIARLALQMVIGAFNSFKFEQSELHLTHSVLRPCSP